MSKRSKSSLRVDDKQRHWKKALLASNQWCEAKFHLQPKSRRIWHGVQCLLIPWVGSLSSEKNWRSYLDRSESLMSKFSAQVPSWRRPHLSWTDRATKQIHTSRWKCRWLVRSPSFFGYTAVCRLTEVRTIETHTALSGNPSKLQDASSSLYNPSVWPKQVTWFVQSNLEVNWSRNIRHRIQ